MLLAIIFLMTSMSTTITTTTSNATDGKIVGTNYPSVPTEGEKNLRITLNYVRSKREFYPPIFSLVSSDGRSNYADFVSDYVASESIVSYRITTSHFSRRCAWQNRVDLTWIFIVDDIEILNSLIREQDHIWKATNQYLVIVTVGANLSRDMFRAVWQTYSVYRIVVISMLDGFRCLSRYLPFEKNPRNEYGVVRKNCLETDRRRDDNVELYSSLDNLNQYPLRVVVFNSTMMNVTYDANTGKPRFRKLDANAMLVLEKMMGARFDYNVFANLAKRDPFQSTLRFIENGEADMIVTAFITNQYREYRRYEFTAGVYEDKLCFIAPTAGFVPKSYMPVMPFASDLWIALAVYNVLVSALWLLLNHFGKSLSRREPVVDLPSAGTTVSSRRRSSSDSPPRINPCVLSCFDLVETMCYPLKEDADTDSAQKALLIGTLFFGLVVTGLYQSCLVSSLSNPFHYPELNTLEQVADSNYTIITKYANLKENTFTNNDTLDVKLQSKFKVVTSNKPTIELVALNKKSIAFTRYSSIELEDQSMYYDADGNNMLHVVDECPTTSLLSYVIRLYSPYREKVDELILRMQQAGLISMWYENLTYPIYALEQRRKMEKSERKIKLTMEHYSLTFVGLLIGLLSCVVLFLAELYYAKRSFNHRHENRSFLTNEEK
ncbi:uncharacterized protein LOC109857851 [Pseudomyrmex gracilis]|uniref:uncharacterized protein LOC109857851 n=1 Tax=Pseudomyrmex gracilis TaxID=219809 RepID=UPI000995DBB5|nr:uncharacterized protein LOC109857851 [Pseudomyrmex gracilis]